MSNVAFYLKYRPQSLSELVGQENVKQSLLAALSKEKLSHAYLFCGPRGTGKTSTARILAKMVNCENSISRDSSSRENEKTRNEVPCNKCSNCISITNGSNMDLIEIDAASNRGIEDIRSLREKIKLSPTNSEKKVYIIDEVHMLTTEAFNALLKTLEEPPSHALFILATTDVQKLPETILSRVQRLDFKLASQEELLKALEDIAKKEKIDIELEALKLIAKKAEGSFRDAVKYLEQVSLLEGKITVEIIQQNLSSSNFQTILDLLNSFVKKDTKSALSIIIKQTEEGVNSKDLILTLMDSLRNLVFIKNGLESLAKENYSESNCLELVKISAGVENKDLISYLDFLQKALEQLKTASIPSLSLELAVVEICSESSKLKVQNSKLEEQIEARGDSEERSSRVAAGALAIEDARGETELAGPRAIGTESDDILKLKEKWTLVLETIRPFNFSLEALLRSSNIKECTESQVIMEVPYSFHQRILESPKNRDLLESVISDVLGRNVRISAILGARNPAREDIANIEVAADDEIIRAAAEIFSSDTIN